MGLKFLGNLYRICYALQRLRIFYIYFQGTYLFSMSKAGNNPYDRVVHPYVDDNSWQKRLFSPRANPRNIPFSDEEKEYIYNHISEKIAVDGIKSARRVKIVSVLTTFRRFLPCEYHKLTLDVWQRSIIAFNASDLSDNTKHDSLIVVKAFLKYLADAGKLPGLTEKQIARVRPVEQPQITKTPDELPTPEEIHTMTTNPNCSVMFAAFLNTLYYTGARVAECLYLNWEDIIFSQHMVKIRIRDSKESGFRYAPCVEAKQYLAAWKRQYPSEIEGGPNGKNPVWVTQNRETGGYGRLQYLRARQWYCDMQERCGIHPRNSKRYYGFHDCRAAHITNCALNGMSDAVIKQIHWANQNSNMMRKYCLLSNDSVERAVLELAGIQEEQRQKVSGVVLCPACNAPNNPLDDCCHFCGTALNAKAAAQQEKIWRRFTHAEASDCDILAALASQLGVDPVQLKRRIFENL